MKSSLRDAAAFGLMLVLGIGLGIGLQKSFDISAQAVNLLQQAGLVRPDGGDGSADVLSDAVESTVPERLQGKLKLYVLVGQSNMVGAARVPDDINPSANIYTFGNDYRWAVATEPVDSARNQIDRVSADPAAGFGPALTFAKTLVAEDSNQLIGLIPCAKDGSSITDWQRSLSSQSLYGSCLKRV
ncbi:MAG: sialate O-acetylesterase [Phormidesmis sp. RL_2_1]|nr:sialate O-acetylesterase [Phormidesmis sp. RL_2_1]